MMNTTLKRVGALAAAGVLGLAACGDDGDSEEPTTDTEPPEAEVEAPPEDATGADEDDGMDDGMDASGDTDESAAADADPAEICDADAIVDAVESGDEAGTLEGMTDDPVGTAASNNPVLTTLTTAVTDAGLVDTLNSADALTVFAPTDCAFAALDAETLDAALDDPEGLLTDVLSFHVVAGEEMSAADLGSEYELETFGGESLSIEAEGDTVTVGDQAEVVVPDIETANATVHLIDTVMLPES